MFAASKATPTEAEALYQDLPHRRDLVLPRPGRLPGLWARRPPGPAPGPAAAAAPCACGWPGAPPARRPTRSPSACWSTRSDWRGNPTFQIFATDLSESGAQEGACGRSISRTSTATSPPSACARFFAKVDGHYQISKDDPGHVRVRPPRPGRRPAVLQAGPHQLPERAHLHGARGSRRRSSRPSTTRSIPGGSLLLGRAEGVGPASTLFSPFDERQQDVQAESDRRRRTVPPCVGTPPPSGRAAAPVVHRGQGRLALGCAEGSRPHAPGALRPGRRGGRRGPQHHRVPGRHGSVPRARPTGRPA